MGILDNLFKKSKAPVPHPRFMVEGGRKHLEVNEKIKKYKKRQKAEALLERAQEIKDRLPKFTSMGAYGMEEYQGEGDFKGSSHNARRVRGKYRDKYKGGRMKYTPSGYEQPKYRISAKDEEYDSIQDTLRWS